MLNPARCLIFGVIALLLGAGNARGEWVWVEGESSIHARVTRHPWWYDKVKKDQLSGGDFISNWSNDTPGQAEYSVPIKTAGEFDFWVRANPIQASLSYRLDGGDWIAINMDHPKDSINIADDGKPDMRFIAWFHAGKLTLVKGENVITFRMDSKNHNHGYLDCFLLTNEPFVPDGATRPDQMARRAKQIELDNAGWFPFNPPEDSFTDRSGFDLRNLNERKAGDGGFIAVKDGQFIHSNTGQPIRFWGVNGPPTDAVDLASLQCVARMLAKRGVNLVRVHGGYFTDAGDVDFAKINSAFLIVSAMKEQGIYCHFSVYFPLWLKPKPGTPWANGYDGKTVPFALLFFNPDFQQKYRSWVSAVLTTKGPQGKTLADDPAVAGIEMQNEDSYFFWTFNPTQFPEPQRRIIESQFADWLSRKYGSLDNTLTAWRESPLPEDAPARNRMAFRQLWNMAHQRTARDIDTAQFLYESQHAFYTNTYQFIRSLHFKGCITASNWITASPQYFGPLEEMSYLPGDFVDRHGYFDCHLQGENAGWSIQPGYTYADRDALRFESDVPGQPRIFSNPVTDTHYSNKPSMISETTFCRPNRYRSEDPIFYAAYGCLQDSDAIIHFALDSTSWSVQPGFFMQPWTIMTPAIAGQFPAAALIYRQQLVDPGQQLVDLQLRPSDMLDLKGTPLPRDANLDDLRAADVPPGQTNAATPAMIDDLVYFAGKTATHFTDQPGPSRIADLHPYVDRAHCIVTASNHQLKLDYAKGILTINAPKAQGVVGNLKLAGSVKLGAVTIASKLDLGCIVLVALDDQPLTSSKKMLLQVMSEEKATGFETVPAGQFLKIKSIGRDPWLVRKLSGTVTFTLPNSSKLRITPLDGNGYPAGQSCVAGQINLSPAILYYLVQR
jgi:hypothetical protein